MSDYQKYKESHLKAQKKYDDKNREKKREYDKRRWQERKAKYQELEQLQQENQKLKKQLAAKVFVKITDDDFLKEFGNMNIEINELKNQQKEFIEYMNKTIEELETDDVGDEELKGYLIQERDTFKEILSKYKEIIDK